MVLSHSNYDVIRRYSITTLANVASQMIGIPFKAHGRSAQGLDCFGVVWEFFRRLGLPVHDLVYPTDWREISEPCTEDEHFERVERCEAGDVLALKLLGSRVENHLCVVLSPEYVLNTNEVIGVHRLRLFAIPKPCWGGIYRHRKLVVV